MSKTPFFDHLNITPWSWNSIGTKILPSTDESIAAAGSAVWPEANLAIYVPFFLQHPMEVGRIFLANGAAVSGNIDVGIYDVKGYRITNMGSTAQSNTNDLQDYSPTNLALGPGMYFMAAALDSTTGTTTAFAGTAPNPVAIVKAMGVLMQPSAFPLPAQATFAVASYNYFPIMGLSPRSSL
jgi:hypothetical protein